MSCFENNIKVVMDAIEEAVIEFDDKSTIINFNNRAKELFDISLNEKVTDDIKKLIHSCKISKVIALGDARKTDIKYHEMRLSTNIVPVINNNKVTGVYAIFFDKTKYDNMAEKIEREKIYIEVLNAMMNAVNEWFVVVDAKARITMMSKAYKEFLNVSEVEGKHVAEVIENTKMHKVLETGEVEVGEIHRVKGNKMVSMRIPIKKNGEIVGAVGKVMFKDISNFHILSKKLANLEREIEFYKNQLVNERRAEYSVDDIKGSSMKLERVKNMVSKVAKTNSNILIFGESGTGKELFAHSIHNASIRASGPFIKVNCAAIPAQLLESELFGYEEGAFTGAKKGGKKGKFELANKGTILLDEIGDMPMEMQVKLLRVIQEKEIERVGGNTPKNIDVRIVSSTNKNLEESIQLGEFREDLYYRLNVMNITIPPLRERREDIIDLTDYLIKKVSDKMGIYVEGITNEALEKLQNYNWPGNIRELENVIERALNLLDTELSITTRQLPERITKEKKKYYKKGNTNLKSIIESVETELIQEVLNENDGNKNKTALQLGISRVGLYKKIEKYNLECK
ncbi:sigma 54-interacting transcriptional regulator [Clostridium sediminicola]|uniref:sigma 54-interacting transcriptional regulator n=1 Tax=Clostridium sediminicola TaxID=3114879 RepID=UPI0031F261CC